MAELKQLGFDTGIFTGTKRRESVGQGLAGIVMQGVSAAQSVMKTDEREAAKLRAEEARNRAAKARDRAEAARLNKENEDADFIGRLNYDTAKKSWVSDNINAGMSATEVSDSYEEFESLNGFEPITDKYMAIARNTRAGDKLKLEQLHQKEIVASSGFVSRKFSEIDMNASEQDVADKIEQIKKTNKDFKGTTYYSDIIASTMNHLEVNKEAYANMSADDILKTIKQSNSVKDSKLRKPLDDYIKDRRIKDISYGDWTNVAEIEKTSKKTGYSNIEVQTLMEKEHKLLVPKLLRDGGAENINSAIEMKDVYGSWATKMFSSENSARIAKGDLSFYKNTRDEVNYPIRQVAEIAGLELLAKQQGLSLENSQELESLQKQIAANKDNKIELEKKGDYLAMVKDYDADGVFSDSANNEEKNFEQFARLHKDLILTNAGTQDNLSAYALSLWENSNVDGLATIGTNINNSKDLDMVKSYLHKGMNGDSRTEIKNSSTGYMIKVPLEKGGSSERFYSVNGMNELLRQSKDFSGVVDITNAIINERIEDLTPVQRKDAHILNNIINSSIDAIAGKDIDNKKRIRIKAHTTNKYRAIIEDLKEQKELTNTGASRSRAVKKSFSKEPKMTPKEYIESDIGKDFDIDTVSDKIIEQMKLHGNISLTGSTVNKKIEPRSSRVKSLINEVEGTMDAHIPTGKIKSNGNTVIGGITIGGMDLEYFGEANVKAVLDSANLTPQERIIIDKLSEFRVKGNTQAELKALSSKLGRKVTKEMSDKIADALYINQVDDVLNYKGKVSKENIPFLSNISKEEMASLGGMRIKSNLVNKLLYSKSFNDANEFADYVLEYISDKKNKVNTVDRNAYRKYANQLKNN